MLEVSVDQLPAWGFLSTAYKGRGDVVPMPLQGDARRYRGLVQALVADLARAFWPRYDAATRTWVGAAREHAIALSHEDLSLMQGLSACLDEPVQGVDGQPSKVDHRYFFEEEDGFKISTHPADPQYPYCAWGESFRYYFEGLSDQEANALSKAFDGSGVAESGGLCVALKIEMQRPRPYQFALFSGWPSHTYETAYTADTPSMVSGHSLQAALSGCHVFRGNRGGILADERLREAWGRFIVDVGDRRVFAGVHYPSDSMSSWYCALRAIDAFYSRGESADIKGFLWDAITRHSRVYARVVERSKQVGSMYPGLLAELSRAAS